jgi:hypothetical protein
MINDELRLIQDAWLKLFKIYITWFTWHFAIHMTLMYGLFSVERLRQHGRLALPFMIAFSSIGGATTIAMFIYRKHVQSRVKELNKELSWIAFGGVLTRYAEWGTLLTAVLVVAMWVYLFWAWPEVTSSCEISR